MSRQTEMARFFESTPRPQDQRVARLFTRVAIGCAAASIMVGVLSQLLFASVFLLAGLVAAWNAYDMSRAYDEKLGKSHPKPSEQKIDGYLAADLHNAATKALRQAGRTAEQVERAIHRAMPGTPLGSRGYPLPPMAHGPVHEVKVDLPCAIDGRARRYRAYHALVLCPTDHHLIVYRCTIDLITGRIGKEAIREVYYRDIALLSVVEKAPSVTFLARDAAGTANGTVVEKEKLRELKMVVAGPSEAEIVAELTPGPELDTVIGVLRGLIAAHKRTQPVEIVPQPLPVRLVEPAA